MLRFVHSSDKNELDKTDDNDDWLWKMRAIFDKRNDSYAKYYNLTIHVAVDEIIMLFEGRVIFKQFIQRNTSGLG